MQTVSGKTRIDRAFTFLEMVVTITILGLVISFALPVMVKARSDTRLEIIYSNLREVESAKDRWALEQNKQAGETPDISVLQGLLATGKLQPVMHETYVPNPIGTLPTAVLSDDGRVGPYGPGETISLPTKSPEVSDAQ